VYKIDLHTHSTASHDGGISLTQYKKTLDSGLLDYIAITDHNNISNAQNIQQQLGDRIIIGEEIMTTEGEIIGLFLKSLVEPGQTPQQTIQSIKNQDGIVYIPHPFETVRKGLHPEILDNIASEVDLVELYNGRVFLQNRSSQTVVWARMNHIPGAASSDAHGYHGLGNTHTIISERPTATNLIDLVAKGTPIAEKSKLRSLLYPKYNKLRRKVRK
jgi:predicted metal-dependent phosphoesterase TrpH